MALYASWFSGSTQFHVFFLLFSISVRINISTDSNNLTTTSITRKNNDNSEIELKFSYKSHTIHNLYSIANGCTASFLLHIYAHPYMFQSLDKIKQRNINKLLMDLLCLGISGIWVVGGRSWFLYVKMIHVCPGLWFQNKRSNYCEN